MFIVYVLCLSPLSVIALAEADRSIDDTSYVTLDELPEVPSTEKFTGLSLTYEMFLLGVLGVLGFSPLSKNSSKYFSEASITLSSDPDSISILIGIPWHLVVRNLAMKSLVSFFVIPFGKYSG